MTTRKPSQRYFRALALEPRILLDAAVVTTAAEVAAQVDAPATTDAPGIKVTPVNQVLLVTDSTDSFPAVDLFKGVDVTLDSQSQKINELVITIDRSGSHEVLVIDGQQIQLTSASGFTDVSEYGYTVSVSGNTSTVTLDFEGHDGIDAEAAEKLIDGLAYQATDKAVAGGAVKVTLVSLNDTGEQKTSINASTAITVDNRVNVAPVIHDSSTLESRENLSATDLGLESREVAYSADGKFAYVAGNNGIQVFSVDASGALSAVQTFTDNKLGTVSHLVLSADGKSAYSISGNSNIVQMSLGSDGKIGDAINVEMKQGIGTGGMALSDDGAYLYVGTALDDVLIYQRDASTGALTFLDRGNGNGNQSARNGLIATVGDYVYITYSGTNVRAPHTLVVYERDNNGKLTQVAKETFDLGRPNLLVAKDIVVSAAGNVYVAYPNGTIAAFHFSNGALTPLSTLPQADVASLAVSADGKTLYAAGNSHLVTYSIGSDGNLTQTASTTGTGSGTDIALAKDGSVLVVGSGLTRYTSMQTLTTGKALPFATHIDLSDINFDSAAADGNYKGASLSVTSSETGGSFAFKNSDTLQRAGDTITLDGTAIASFKVVNGILSVTFTADVSKAVANQVIDQLTYTSAPRLAAGSLVTLSLRASDGTLDSGTVELVLQAKTSNEAPAIDARPGALELFEQLEFDADQSPSIRDVLQVADKTYVLRTLTKTIEVPGEDPDWPEHVDVVTRYIDIFVTGADGKLTLLETVAESDSNALKGAVSLGVSADGATLYVMTDSDASSGVSLFSRNVDGTLVAQGTLPDTLGFISDMQIQGDAVYVTNSDGLSVFKKNAGGWVQSGDALEAGDGQEFTSLQLSADGSRLFASVTGGKDLLLVAFAVNADGSLKEVGRAGAGEHFAGELIISTNGKQVYVLDGTGDDSRVRIVDVATDGRLSLRSAALDVAGAQQIILTTDGHTLLVIGDNQVRLFARQANGGLSLLSTTNGVGEADEFTGEPSINFDTVRGATLSADGKQLYLAGEFGWNEGVLVLALKAADVSFVEGETAVVILPGGTLADLQLDAQNGGKGDYKGASIVIERAEGANKEDLFAFLDANGLTLDKATGKVSLAGAEVASFSQLDGKLTLTFTASISQADAQNVLRQITYSNSSKDPAESAALRITINDGDGNSDAMQIDITLEGRNDPAEVETTPLNPTAPTGADPVKLFENTTINTIEADQQIWKVVVTIEGAHAKDMLGVGLDQIDLGSNTSGVVTAENGQEYQVLVAGGKTTVTLFLMADSAKAAALIDSLTYRHTGSEVSGTRTVSLTLFEDVDFQHPDPKNDSTLFDEKSVITLKPLLPGIEATGNKQDVRINNNGTLPDDIDLFSDVTISAGLDDAEIESLIITVDRHGDKQALIIGDSVITLTETSLSQGNGYTYEVKVEGDTTTVTLTFSDKNTAEVGQLIDGIAYRVLDSTVATGSLSVTLSEIRNTQDAEAQPGISANITLAVNTAPLPEFGNFTLSDAKAGKNYDLSLPAHLFTDADDDTLTWDVKGLPAGLIFNPETRTISGSTMAMGEHKVVISVRDGWGGEASNELALTVVNSAPEIGVDHALGKATIGQAYSATLPENLFVDANDSELEWKLDDLPDWLVYDSATRTLSGTAPAEAGSFTITITATDEHGASVERSFTLVVAANRVVTPEIVTGYQQQTRVISSAIFGSPSALKIDPILVQDLLPLEDQTRPTASMRSLLGSHDLSAVDSKLVEQLSMANSVLTDTGAAPTTPGLQLEGNTLRGSVSSSQEPSVSLQIPRELPNGDTPQRVTLNNGFPLPSWASFDVRTGELRIDRERLQRDGLLRLTLISRDAEGNERRTPVEIRAEGAAAQSSREAPQNSAPAAESVPEKLQHGTSGALLSDALQLLDQLSDLAGEPVTVTTRHIA